VKPSRFEKESIMSTHLRHRLRIGTALLLLASACGDGPTAPPEPGTIRVTIATTGGDPDDNGYEVVLGGNQRYAVSQWTTSVLLRDLSPGTHALTLEGVAENCTLQGAPQQSVTVVSGSTVDIAFAVECEATGVRVTVRTSGPEFPGLFGVQFSSGSSGHVLSNGTTVLSRLSPGNYTLTLTDVTEYCEVLGEATVSVVVANRSLTDASFDVTCRAAIGAIQVTLVTSGSDLDPNGYTLFAAGRELPAPINGVLTIDGVAAGAHTVRLGHLAPNCRVPGGEERTVELTAGGVTRDTARVTFEALCERTDKILYVTFGGLYLAYADGSNATALRSGTSASWSPDGKRLVYFECDFYYSYYYSCSGLRVFDTETRTEVLVPNTVSGLYPSWSPTGSEIAFVAVPPGGNELALMLINVDGSDARPVWVANPAWSGPPSWSPDGQKIAFSCSVVPGQLDICVVNRDGTGFSQLTDDTAPDFDPAWSPDGSTIAYTTRFTGSQGTEIVLITAGGSYLRTLASGFDPAWSADGSRIVFARGSGLSVINADGTGLHPLTTGQHSAPAWRP
jgi:hypothetical protein